MYETFLEKILNPNTFFLAGYVGFIVVIAYIGLFYQFFKIRNLKQENQRLKQQSTSETHSTLSLEKH